MAVYKVIQDIEAEDKLLGPLTLKGFIYAATTMFLAFINYRIVITPSLGYYRWGLLLIFLFPMLLFAVLASPLGREQPTEVWLLSHIRFFLKPRGRIWDQSGIKELVTITVPKKIDKFIGKNITQSEVGNRLKTLASTLDSRGWVVKNVAVDNSSLMSYLQEEEDDSERLVSASSVLQTQPVDDVQAADDILDEQNNPKAQQVESLLQTQDSQRKTNLVSEMSNAQQGGTLPQLGQANPAPAVGSTSTDTSHLPAGRQVTPPAQTAKLKELAQSGNALSVASVAQLANRVGQVKQISPNEVVISLH